MADDIRTCADLDERLTPYVDGEDTPTSHRAVGAHLQACPPCGRLAHEEATAREVLHAHRGAVTAHAPESLRARCAANLTPPASFSPTLALIRRWAPLSLAATLVLAVAGVFLFGLNDGVQALAASLAADHVTCFKVNGAGGETEAQMAERAWQDDQGWPIVVPRAEPAQQLKLIGVRHCLSTAGHVAHMMYTWGGEPLSVYVLQADAGRDAVAHRMGAQEIIWRANSRTYAIVSGDTTRDLTPVVAYLKARVR
jgi:anti-sigma factor RsiW